MLSDSCIANYKEALAAQDWTAVAPLIHPDACFFAYALVTAVIKRVYDKWELLAKHPGPAQSL